VTKLWISIVLASTLGLILANFVLARPANQQPPSSPEFSSLPASITTLHYARVLTTSDIPVYQTPEDASNGVDPVRWLAKGYFWVSLVHTQTVQVDETHWYMINEGEYIQADHLQFFTPSGFRGIERPGSATFAWIIFDTWTTAVPGEPPGDDSMVLRRYTIVPILGAQVVEDRIWYKVDEGRWVEQGMVGIVSPKPRPEGVGPNDKWIEIDLYEQTLAAYEGDEIVYATLVSSGLPYWRTVSGLFQIWVKVREGKMSGRDGFEDYYFLEDVPWSMYFSGAYALHGAYWHDRFGIRHSHGCVNISLMDAKWLFEWTTPEPKSDWTRSTEENVGTWIWVHDGHFIEDQVKNGLVEVPLVEVE
jgi:hypothetical protein